MIVAAYTLLFAAALLFLVRLLRGPSLVDRAVGVDGLLVCGFGLLVVQAIETQRGTFMPVGVMVTLVGFVSTAVIARYIEGRLHDDEDPAGDPNAATNADTTADGGPGQGERR